MPFKKFFHLDNYIRAYLLENRVEDETRQTLLHFLYQYLSKVGNIHFEEAFKLKRDVSIFRSRNRLDYQRVYWQYNEPLREIETLISKKLKLDQRILLVNDRSLPKELQPHLREYQGQKFLIFPMNKFDFFMKKIVRGGFTLSMQDTAGRAARFGIGIENPTFDFPKKIETPIKSFQEFLHHPNFCSFKEKILPVLIEGFKEIPLDLIFEKKGVHQILQDSYQRILFYCQIKEPESWIDLQEFENALELIYEEILLWLMIAKPYSESDFASEIQMMIPSCHFSRTTQSGMGALSEIITLLFKPDSVVLYYDDCYFESLDLICFSKCYQIDDLDHLIKSRQKIDFLLVDFRHDLLSILEKVYPHISPSFVLIIDLTIGFQNEIEPILKAYPKLNVIIFWSHQKFDQFGIDKLSGGSYALYSQNYNLIDQFKSIRGGEIDWVSLQGLTHFFKYGKTLLQKRTQQIFLNAQYVYHKIDPQIQIDPYCFSVDVQGNWITHEEKRVLEEFEKRGVPLLSRPSFGYNTISFDCIGNQVLRFSIGTEKKQFLDQFINVFNSIFPVKKITSKRIGKKIDISLNRS